MSNILNGDVMYDNEATRQIASFVRRNIPDDGERQQHYDAKPATLLEHVQEVVKQREQVYGPAKEHWGKAAKIANILFDLNLDAETWGKLWIVDKLVRDSHLPGRDHLADIVGYADGIDRIRGRS